MRSRKSEGLRQDGGKSLLRPEAAGAFQKRREEERREDELEEVGELTAAP